MNTLKKWTFDRQQRFVNRVFQCRQCYLCFLSKTDHWHLESIWEVFVVTPWAKEVKQKDSGIPGCLICSGSLFWTWAEMSQQQPHPKQQNSTGHNSWPQRKHTLTKHCCQTTLTIQGKATFFFFILKSNAIFFPNPSESGYRRCNIPSGNCISRFLRCIWRAWVPACAVCVTALQRNDLLFPQQPLPPPVRRQSYGPAALRGQHRPKGSEHSCTQPPTPAAHSPGKAEDQPGSPPASSCTEARIIRRS